MENKQLAPTAITALVLGILSISFSSLILPGFILGIIGKKKANEGYDAIAANPTLFTGEGMLKAARITSNVGFFLSLVGIIIALIVMFMWNVIFFGGDPSSVTQQLQQGNLTEYVVDGQDDSEDDKELMTFCSQILASTEDVWTAEFQKMGRTYQPPKMVIFSDAVNSGCGNATSASGPFYCSADETVYIDLEFFKSMKKQIGADGDFAYAYVIAHEVGHHVQNQLGILGQAHQKMAQYGKDTQGYNQTSVRLELQADFFAGVWAHHDNKMFGLLEDGDIEEALNAAAKNGDDYLQKQAYGRTMPETFNHGTSAMRSRWLKKGVSIGDINQGDTFSPTFSSL